MTIKGVLLSTASLSTLMAGAAAAKSAPQLLVAEMHPGHATIKTAAHIGPNATLTSTAGVSTGVTVSADYKVKTNLAATYYTFLNSGTFCKPPKESVVLSTTKTKFAMLSTSTETYSEGCSTPTTFYGDVYELTSKKKGTDSFVSSLIGKKVHFQNTVYKTATLNLDVSVAITK